MENLDNSINYFKVSLYTKDQDYKHLKSKMKKKIIL